MLSRNVVLDAALRLVDEQGLSALTMRRLAGELGVEAMSLYHHVVNKADLLDGITARVFEQIPIPDPVLPWDERLRAFAYAIHKVFGEHPEVARAMAVHQTNPRSPESLEVIDALLAAILECGIDERGAARAYCTIFEIGISSLRAQSAEAPTPAAPDGDSQRWIQRHAIAERYPSLHRVLPALLTLDRTSGFESRVERFLGDLRSHEHQPVAGST